MFTKIAALVIVIIVGVVYMSFGKFSTAKYLQKEII